MMLDVFYDGKCGMCRREIAFYRRITPPARINWVNLAESSALLNAQGVALIDGLKVIHVRDDRLGLLTGVDAFKAIWRAIPLFRPLALVVSLPQVGGLAERAYARFADWRFKRLGYDACDL